MAQRCKTQRKICLGRKGSVGYTKDIQNTSCNFQRLFFRASKRGYMSLWKWSDGINLVRSIAKNKKPYYTTIGNHTYQQLINMIMNDRQYTLIQIDCVHPLPCLWVSEWVCEEGCIILHSNWVLIDPVLNEEGCIPPILRTTSKHVSSSLWDSYSTCEF